MYFKRSLMPNKTPISTRALYFPLCGSENVCDFGRELQINIFKFFNRECFGAIILDMDTRRYNYEKS